MAKKKNTASAANKGAAPSATPPAAGDIQSALAGPLPLALILLFALALRAWGITWGLPSATHVFSYHPDETDILDHAWYGMSIAKGQLLPGFYNYGSLQLYLILIANTIAHPSLRDNYTPYLVGRMLSLAMGVGTVWATSALGAKLWGRTCGLLAALFLALMPLHAQHSHFMTVDVPGTLWVVLSFLYAAKITDDPRPSRAAIVAGVLAGLAAATKYNLALVILPALLAALAAKRAKLLGAIIPAAALSFLIACPGFLLQNGQFMHDFDFEAVHVRNIHDPTFVGTGNGFLFHLTHNLDPGMGIALLALSLVSIVFAVARRERGDELLAAFALPYYLLIGLAAVRYARYTIPLLPVLALWSARLVAEFVNIKPVAIKTSVRILAAIICVATLVNCVVLTEYEYTDALRVGSPATLAYLRALDASYSHVAVFDTPSPTLTGGVVVDGLPERQLPHDMRYPSPIILVYARK